ncbi:MAG: hypothetical protein P4K86_06700 [Terracidiphilus sp.]|nr:hypothetical protein [Terracidiphilus sp.]MDR3776813.1 hypothetical protein [Terracidiphilus sp.]
MVIVDNAELQSRMRPGAFSRVGFLGPQESLQEVLEADRIEVERLGLTFTRLAESLEKLIDAAEASSSRKAKVDGMHRIEIEQFTGFQICPWAPDPHHAQCTAGQGVRHASVNWRIVNLNTGQVMRGPGLAVHLMRDHHFCQGKESPLRVDPGELARLLGLL